MNKLSKTEQNMIERAKLKGGMLVVTKALEVKAIDGLVAAGIFLPTKTLGIYKLNEKGVS